jgi:hypothetical protein
LYILENTPSPPGEMSADIILWEKYEKEKRKRGKCEVMRKDKR